MKEERCGRFRFGAVLGATGLMLLLLAGPARPDTKGFLLGLDLHYSKIGAEEESESSGDNSVFVDEDGGGVTILVGYGFTPSFALRLAGSASNHETSDSDVEVIYSNSLIEAMYIFREAAPLRPYILGGIGGARLESRDDPFRYETTGSCADLGFGFLYFTGEHFAIESALRLEFVNWDKATASLETDHGTVTVETPVEDEGSALKVLFGVNYWF
jgi:hypothetical protein